MSKHLNIKNLLIVVLITICIYQFFENSAFKTTLKNNELAKLDTIEYYKNAIGLEVAEKLTYKGTTEQLEVYLSEKSKESEQFKEAAKGWRKKYNALQIKLEFVLDSIDVPFNKPVHYNFERTFEKLTKEYVLKGIANQNGLQIDFRAKAEVTSFTGIKPFSTQTTTSLTSSTGLLRVSNFDNYSFLPSKKRWSLNSSIFINTKGEIHFGVGVGYDWLKF